jgi:hypothetical protein
VPSSNESGISFRPGSTTLAFTDNAEGHRKNQQVQGQYVPPPLGPTELRLRDVVQSKDIGVVPGVSEFLFSPDGARLVVQGSDPLRSVREDDSQYPLRFVRASDLREDGSRPSGAAVAFLSDHELLIREGPQYLGWDVGTGHQTFASTVPAGWGASPFDPFGSMIPVFDGAHNMMALWDARSGQVARIGQDVLPAHSFERRSAPASLAAFDVRHARERFSFTT